MKIVLQRVKQANVKVANEVIGQIRKGMVILLGVAKGDTEQEVVALVDKAVQLRIFDDENGKMNVSGLECDAEFLVVSQFTLLGNCDKGRRPSFDGAAEPMEANRLYELFVSQLKAKGVKVETGKFAAMMDVSLVNDGPVTFTLESGA